MKLPPTTDMSIAPVSIMEIAHHKDDSTDNFRKSDLEYDYGMGSKWAGLVSEARELAARFNKDMSGGQDILGNSMNVNLDDNGQLGSEDLVDEEEDDEAEDDDEEEETDEHRGAANVLKSVPNNNLNTAVGTITSAPEFSNDFPFANDIDNSDSSDDDEDEDYGDASDNIITGGNANDNKITEDGNPFDIDLNHWSTDESSESEDESYDTKDGDDLVSCVNCTVCGKEMKNKYTLKRHMEILHPEESILFNQTDSSLKGYHCRTCNAHFENRSLLMAHAKEYHPNNSEPLECKVCGKKYSKLFSLQRHEAAHEGKSIYRCRTCDQLFPSREVREKVSSYHKVILVKFLFPELLV